MKNRNEKSTECVHGGQIIDEATKGMVTPVYPSSSFDYIDTEVQAYPRYFNTPNQKVVSEKLRLLENGEAGMVTSSGMAAISTVLFGLLSKGDHAIFQQDLYGGTYHAIMTEMEKYGISYTFVDASSRENVLAAFRPETRLLYLETPSNPLMYITDIQMMAEIGAEKGVVTIVDNTFASPINQNPLDFGIDVSIHSGTKYLGGHSDLCCGAIISSQSLMDKFWGTAIHLGGSLNAQTCHLLERSLKTLSIRVVRQNENALKVAEYLQSHDLVKKVNYPGLKSHPQHALASAQMSGFGGMLSFEVDLAGNEIDGFLKRLKIIHSAMSLGGVESIISSPFRTSHAKMTAEQRAKAGISDQLLRLSVGIEDYKDLRNDIEQALAKNLVMV